MARIIRLDQLQQFAAINLSSDAGAVGGKIVVPNCVQIGLNWSSVAGGKTAHIVTYGRAAGVPSPTAAQAQAIFSALTTGAAFTAINALFSTGGAFGSVTLRSVHSVDQPIFSSTGGAVTGTAPGAPLPSETAIVVTKRTALVGPGARGRMYFPNWSVDSLGAGNVVAAATITALQTWVNGFASIFSAQGYTHVLGRPARGGYTGTTGTVHPPRLADSLDITQLLVRDNHWDTQRRRGLK